MATYKEIHGIAIKDESSDPTITGEIFYNSTTDTFRSIVQSAAWVSQTPTVSQHGDGTGCGTASATLLWGGYAPSNQQPPSGYTTTSTEEFNGSGWTAGGNYPVSFFRAGSAGTQTAALGIAGRTGNPAANQDDCFKYDGSTWTATTNYPASKNGVGATGTQTAAIAVGGAPYVDTSFEFDGSSWTSSGTYPVSRVGIRGAGTQTAGIFAGGSEPVVSTATTYDGSSFSVVGSLNTARAQTTHSGNSGSSVLCGGSASPGPSNATERWDGTSWTTSPATLSIGGYGGGAGAMSNPAGNTSALMGALRGPPSGYPTNIEEFSVSTNVITAAAWASGGAIPTATSLNSGAGTQTAALTFAGSTGPAPSGVNTSLSYDGSSWTSTPNLYRVAFYGSGCGTQTAALNVDGIPAGGGTSSTQEFNGSSWSEGGALSDGNRFSTSTFGIQTAAIAAGYAPGGGTKSEQYNGTAWTTTPALPYSTYSAASGGTTSAGFVAGGGNPIKSDTVEWDGEGYTAGGSLITGRRNTCGGGTQTAGIIMGGYDGNASSATEGYDGTAWSSRPSMGTARYSLASSTAGPNTATMVIAGTTAGGTKQTITEEFTGETTAVNVKTITTS